jgi:hypothetical protein
VSFEPNITECTRSDGKVCDHYRDGDGKHYISRCLVDNNPNLNPPHWCNYLVVDEDYIREAMIDWQIKESKED